MTDMTGADKARTYARARGLQALCLSLYGLARRSGLLSTTPGRVLFDRCYEIYKLRLEARSTDHLHSWVPAGSWVIDVGANAGFFTRRFARWVGAEGRVVAIEPDDANIARLRNALAKDGLSTRVMIVCGVAAEKDGELLLRINPDHPGDHRIAQSGVPVRAVSLDSIFDSENRPDVSFLKIDVQGAEKRVLDGALQLIETSRPVIFVEIEPAALSEHGTSAQEVLEFLTRRHYRPHVLGKQGNPVPVTSDDILSLAGRNGGYVDVLCLPDEDIGRPGVRS